jgi:hypothetical protein
MNLPAAAWRARVFELAEALFQSIRMQLSVTRYQAIGITRGANLDLIDVPLTDAPWLHKQFEEISALTAEPARLARIDEILNWSNPGPGGFYDNLGDPAARPHLVMGTSYADDPAFLHAPLTGFSLRRPGAPRRISSSRHAVTLFEQPLEMLYHGLDKTAHYKVKVMYGIETGGMVRFAANEKFEIHPLKEKPIQTKPVEYDLPPDVTAGGELRLTWTGTPGTGGNGRTVQVAEVWLVRVN